jgi:hypothetical protein
LSSFGLIFSCGGKIFSFQPINGNNFLYYFKCLNQTMENQ